MRLVRTAAAGLRALAAPGALGALALLAGCWVSSEQGEKMQRDLDRTRAELREARQEILRSSEAAEADRTRLKAEQDDASRRIDDKLAEVTKALDDLNRTARKSGADLGVQLEQTQNDVEKLRGTMEEHLHRIEQVEAQAASFKSELEQKIAALDELQKKQAEAAAAREKDREKQQAAAAAAKKEDETPEDKQGLYDDARKKLDEGAAGDARKGFQAFLKKWPKDALAANAQYWLGETYYADGKYQEAIVEFQKVREQHPKSEKAADALLKLGYSFAQLNMSKEASLFLDEVIQKHPATPAARLAKDKLKQLKDGKK